MGANVLVEFENVFLIGGIVGGKKLFWDRENQHLGNYIDLCYILLNGPTA